MTGDTDKMVMKEKVFKKQSGGQKRSQKIQRCVPHHAIRGNLMNKSYFYGDMNYNIF